MVLGLNLDVWEWKIKDLAREVLRFSQFLDSPRCQSPFCMIMGAMGAIFKTLVALESGLKFDDFSG